jgi:hypothetical protein
VLDLKIQIALQKCSQTSPKSILALHNMKKINKKCQYAWDNAQLMGHSMLIFRVQLKEQDFEKNKLEDFQALQA